MRHTGNSSAHFLFISRLGWWRGNSGRRLRQLVDVLLEEMDPARGVQRDPLDAVLEAAHRVHAAGPEQFAQQIDQALTHHQSGRLDEAERLYRQILAQAPDHPNVLNLLGVLAHQKGDNATAIALLRRAVERSPREADYLSNLGSILQMQGQLTEAARCFDRALTVDPTHWQMMMFVALAWLPVLLAHTTAQTVLELRQRCAPAYQPVPLQPLNRFTLPVVLYDEQGNPIAGGEDRMNYLPR